MEQLVTEKVDIFWKGIESGVKKCGQVIVTFLEKKAKKSWFQVYVGEEEVPWEQWIVNAEMRQPKSEDWQEFNANLVSTLLKALNVMLTHTSSEHGRTTAPLITNVTGISPLPIKIAVKVGGVELG
ncbi:hypothetical protein EV702DRAFT_1147319 [Suillus placidus]|uniref:Autophagy-related protein 101 n=1 Tax=Suillus placidus TaxID=48579 RepID=A0A9P6ZIB4_9AGAM|nr:hypothetical protein EV702DRAFT_1147319 [Suillus placidus]